MSFEGTWVVRCGEIYKLLKLERPGGTYLTGDEIYHTEARDDLRWDSEGNAIREDNSIYIYREKTWHRDKDYDLMERISEKDQRK